MKTETAESPEYRAALIPLYFLLGDPNGVQAQMDWAAGKPEEYLFITNVAVVREFAGRYREAQDLYQHAFDEAEQQKLPDVAAAILLGEAQGKAIAGMCNDVPALVKQALSLDKSKRDCPQRGLASRALRRSEAGASAA